jgi:hypothetical protein
MGFSADHRVPYPYLDCNPFLSDGRAGVKSTGNRVGLGIGDHQEPIRRRYLREATSAGL